MQKALKHLATLDWILAFAALGYGIWSQSWLILGVGALGLLLAWVSPAKRLQTKIQKSSFANRRRAKDAAAAQAAIDAVADSEAALSEEPTSAESANVDYRRPMPAYTAIRLNPSKHNRLKQDSFNLVAPATSIGFN